MSRCDGSRLGGLLNRRGTGSRRSSSIHPSGTTMASAWRRHSTPARPVATRSYESIQTIRCSASNPYVISATCEHPGRSHRRVIPNNVPQEAPRLGLSPGQLAERRRSRWQRIWTRAAAPAAVMCTPSDVNHSGRTDFDHGAIRRLGYDARRPPTRVPRLDVRRRPVAGSRP